MRWCLPWSGSRSECPFSLPLPPKQVWLLGMAPDPWLRLRYTEAGHHRAPTFINGKDFTFTVQCTVHVSLPCYVSMPDVLLMCSAQMACVTCLTSLHEQCIKWPMLCWVVFKIVFCPTFTHGEEGGMHPPPLRVKKGPLPCTEKWVHIIKIP